MKDKKTLGTIVAVVAAIIILAVIFAWGKTETKQTTEKAAPAATTEQPATTDTGDAGKLGANEIAITAANFDSKVVAGSNGKLVVVDVYAPWCPHCQKMGPIVTALADEYAGKVVFGKFNADNQDTNNKTNYDFAIAKGLEGYPTFWFYKDGKLVGSFSGEKTSADFKTEVQKYL
ncbi:MAG: thioredoxin domain-containing protein [Patescibacteria group bacterium]|jgi:thioredoxin-like negative regulator of GroEL|nr:thioredoxin domain-containing protein [Patescibacteria group bacterium]